MTIDEAKKELREIGKLNRAIVTLQETITRNRAKLTGISAPLSKDKVQTSHNNDQMAEGVAQILILEADLKAKVKEYSEKQSGIVRKIWAISDVDEQTVLIARYLNGKEWAEIAAVFQCDIRRVYQIHREALQNFCQVVQEI